LTAFQTLALITTVLLATVFLLCIGIVFAHQCSLKREQKIKLIRDKLKQDIFDYLNGKIDAASLIVGLSSSPKLVMGLFAQCLISRSKEDRQKLVSLLKNQPLNEITLSVVKKLHSQQWHLRQQAATYAPYALPDPSACLELINLLSDTKTSVRLTAAHALSMVDDPSTISTIIEKLSDISNLPANRITEVLCNFKSPISTDLLQLLERKDTNARIQSVVINTLGELSAYEAQSSIALFLNSKNMQLKIEAVKALGKLKSRKFVPELIAILNEPRWELRAICAKALGEIGDPRAAQSLSEQSKDSVWWVRHNCCQALANMGNTGLRLLEQNLGHDDAFVRDISRVALNDLHFLQSLSVTR
jgi:HEAT repeat protein